MKTSRLLLSAFTLLIFGFVANLQVLQAQALEVDSTAWKASMQELFADAKKRFADVKTGTGTPMEDGTTGRFDASKVMSQAATAWVTVDKEKHHKYYAHYPAMEKINDAGLLFNELLALAENAAPEGYKSKKAYSDDYISNLKYEIQLDTEDFSALGRVPSYTMGMVKTAEGKYAVEIIIAAPWW